MTDSSSDQAAQREGSDANKVIETGTAGHAPVHEGPPSPRGFRFYIVLVGLLLAALLTWLDGGTISTALPTIAADLDLGPAYVWVANSYFLTMAAFQPLFGQLSDLWGRRWIFIATVALFVLGSGLIGGAHTGAMLIAGRSIQGTGAGGINMMVDLVVCDLVPLRERGKYMGMIFGIGATISAVGPLIAGALTEAGPGAWRWIFWINLPLGGICIIVMLLWFRVSHRRDGPGFVQRIRSVDWVGTGIIVASTVAVLWSLAYGGSSKPWSDAGVVAGLVTGIIGLLLFAAWEGTPWCKNPLTPLRLFSNRTSAVAFFLTLMNAMLIFWVVFMFPIYFQAVLGASPRESGLWLLPFAFAFPVGAALSGNLMTKFGRYRPLHLIGFALCVMAYGLCSILDRNSHKAVWVIFQLILAFGIALPVATLLPAVQAPLSEEDAATSTGAWAFLRSYGSIFGAAIPAAVFNDRFNGLLGTIGDESARALLSGGDAYSRASPSVSMGEFSSEVRDQVINVYNMSLRRVWQIGIVFAGVSFLLLFLEKEVALRQELETDFGLEKQDVSTSQDEKTAKSAV
ncbi:Efflux pump FUS6 [Lachnellula arida]|uniref:Efflux pump FUS6 n=1 Tax=Lachnellula arida TaxID=1316785 RepID=A0A8T9BLS0_9HELO|nr:Efflux pump FUS6 [Lachnellula arida]